MKSFFNCNMFKERVGQGKFEIFQDILTLDKHIGGGKYSFLKNVEIFRCFFSLSKVFDKEKPVVIIPIKDNKKMLQFTLSNLEKYKVTNICNVVVVDDRSEEKVSSFIDANISTIRVDTDYGFNFSMLNNIAAKLFYDLGCKEAILWNSDLWCYDSETIPKLLKKHRELGSSITGTKLIYPPKEMSLNGNLDSENIKKIFPNKTNGAWRNTVQFGGDIFHNGVYHHYGRFKDPRDFRINCNRPASFITGAFQILNLDDFIKLGGLNPSLCKNFQDNDYCLKVIESGKKIYYCGRDCGMYHDESAILHANKLDKKITSNQVLFLKIWSNKMGDLL